ncbi:MAG TPA: AI-2E family transporter, partial [Vicinamibacterales bacterium]|nr:AI-2E family transporter [Vicinamibacterales bacterium]
MKRSASPALWILVTIAAIWLLRTASQLLIPIAIGILISYILEPIVGWLERRRCPRMVGASLVMLVLLGLCAWGVYSLRDDVIKATEALPKAARRAREMLTSQGASGPAASVRQAAAELKGATAATGGAAGGQQQSTNTQAGEGAQQRGESQQSGDAQQGGSGQAGGAASGVSGLVQMGVSSVVALAGHLLTIVFLVFFLLLSGDHFRKRLVEVSGPEPERRRLAAKIIQDINSQIERFLFVRAVTGAIVAAATWLVLAWMGVGQAAVWGILAGVFNSIPYFGPVIVSGGLLVVGLVQSGDFMQAMKMSGAALVITSIERWLLTPPLMGKAERMSATVVFL